VVLVVLVLVVLDEVVVAGRVVVVVARVEATVTGAVDSVVRATVVVGPTVVGVVVVVGSVPSLSSLSSLLSWVTANRTRAITTTAAISPMTSGQLF